MSEVYIEKAAFKAMLDKRIYCLCGGETVKETKNIRDLLEAFPPADAKPVVKGEWERHWNVTFGWVWKCSSCGQENFFTVTQYNFCPNCGADMRKEAADE